MRPDDEEWLFTALTPDRITATGGLRLPEDGAWCVTLAFAADAFDAPRRSVLLGFRSGARIRWFPCRGWGIDLEKLRVFGLFDDPLLPAERFRLVRDASGDDWMAAVASSRAYASAGDIRLELEGDCLSLRVKIGGWMTRWSEDADAFKRALGL